MMHDLFAALRSLHNLAAFEATVFAAAITTLVLASVVAAAPRHVAAALGAVVVGGAALRWWLSPETLLGMSNYMREPVLFPWTDAAGLPLRALFPDGWDRWQQILTLNFAVSCILPLVVFAHAEVCFRDSRVSLFAALLFAVCPLPIYFSHSDTLYVTSALLSSITFVLLHETMVTRQPLWEIVCGAATVVLFGVVLGARQENFLFGGLALAPAILALRSKGRGRHRRAGWALLLLAIAWSAYWDMARAQSGTDTDATGVLAHVFRIWTTDPLWHLAWTNNYLLRPWVFPLVYSALAAAGLAWTWRHDRAAFGYIVWWFAVFYIGHGIIPAWDDTAAARYGMHTIIPVSFAAAFGLAWVVDAARAWSPANPNAKRSAVAAAVLFAAVTTWWGAGLLRLGESDLQQEYRFLRELARRGIPERGALVIESYGGNAGVDFGDDFFALKTTNRFEYFGRINRGGEDRQEIVAATTFLADHHGPVYLYTGLPCLWLRRAADTSAPCRAALDWAQWEEVAALRIDGRQHDLANGADAAGGVITLWRLVGPAPSPPPAPVELPAIAPDAPRNPLMR